MNRTSIKTSFLFIVLSLLPTTLLAVSTNKQLPYEVVRARAKAQGNNSFAIQPIPIKATGLAAKPKPVPKLAQHRRVMPPPYVWVKLMPGSLRSNIKHLAARFGWSQVVWTLNEDYRWIGKTQVRTQNLPSLLSKILQDYPLQAVFYRGNHVLVIRPRTLR